MSLFEPIDGHLWQDVEGVSIDTSCFVADLPLGANLSVVSGRGSVFRPDLCVMMHSHVIVSETHTKSEMFAYSAFVVEACGKRNGVHKPILVSVCAVVVLPREPIVDYGEVLNELFEVSVA